MPRLVCPILPSTVPLWVFLKAYGPHLSELSIWPELPIHQQQITRTELVKNLSIYACFVAASGWLTVIFSCEFTDKLLAGNLIVEIECTMELKIIFNISSNSCCNEIVLPPSSPLPTFPFRLPRPLLHPKFILSFSVGIYTFHIHIKQPWQTVVHLIEINSWTIFFTSFIQFSQFSAFQLTISFGTHRNHLAFQFSV